MQMACAVHAKNISNRGERQGAAFRASIGRRPQIVSTTGAGSRRARAGVEAGRCEPQDQSGERKHQKDQGQHSPRDAQADCLHGVSLGGEPADAQMAPLWVPGGPDRGAGEPYPGRPGEGGRLRAVRGGSWGNGFTRELSADPQFAVLRCNHVGGSGSGGAAGLHALALEPVDGEVTSRPQGCGAAAQQQ